MHESPSTWLTNDVRIPVCDSLQQLEDVVGCKVLYFINSEDQAVLGYKTLRCKDAVASFK